MLGDSGVLASSGEDKVVAGALEGDEAADVIEEDKGGDRSNSGGNRWPRPETLALLKIRSDMDAVFRDSSLKGPLWEDVSRKLGELGYSRSAKKCKEKFENVYKYHKRTKEGRTGKAEGKTYRFFDQLQALENQPEGKTTPAVHWTNSTTSTVPLTTNPTIMFQSNPIIPPIPAKNPAIPSAQTNILWRSSASTSLFSSTSTSSSTASDREFKEPARKRSKRKWKDFFQTLTMEVIEKQEQLQQKFLDTIEKHENERIVKEEAWRKQEMARLNREHEILIQERSTAAAKDAAVLALLHKISGQQQQQTHDVHDVNTTTTLSLPMPRPPPQQPPPPLSPASSSRWPKAEVQALINLRSVLDLKYQENGPKGPLWEEISAGMRRIGYSRSAKRCKEKWENINKYFKKVKGSNIKRPEDSKTCPYFHQLDALYKEKNKIINQMEPLMVEPEQQWPLQEDHNNQEQEITAVMEDINIHHKENVEQNDDHQEDDNDIADSTDEEDDGGGYEMVINKPSSVENIAK